MLKKLSFATALVALLVVMSLVSTELAYAEQLPPGILIAGQSFSGQNKTAVLAALKASFKSIDDQGVTLVLGDKQLKAKFSDLGIVPNYEDMGSRAFSKSHATVPGQGTLRIIAAYITKSNNVPLGVSIDQNINHQFLDATLHSVLGERPVDAGLMINNNTVTITEPQNGLWIKDDLLMNQLISAMQTGATTVAVPNEVQKPEVVADNLVTAKSEAEKLIARTVTLDANGSKITVSSGDVAAWIFVQADQGQYHARLDPEKIKTFLNEKIAPKVNKKAIAAVKETDGDVTKAGQDGVKLLVNDSITAITKALDSTDQKSTVKLAIQVNNKSTIVVDPQSGCDPNKSAGKYIEINLTDQKMCLFEGATFINSFRVSTGKWSTPTPVGTFAVQNKIRVAYSAKYGLYMPYWKAITPDGEYGIHGLPYRGNWIEGANHIGTPVSHGCIRLGPGDDVFVDSWADIGTPVIIHK